MFSSTFNLEGTYNRAIKFSFAYVADAILFVLATEIIRHWFRPFSGFVQVSNIAPLRYFFFALALSGFFFIRLAANYPLKIVNNDDKSESFLLSRLTTSSLIIYGSCEAVTFLGFLLFIFNGLNRDFYAFLGLSIFYFVIFFPRKREWKNWLKDQNPLSSRH